MEASEYVNIGHGLLYMDLAEDNIKAAAAWARDRFVCVNVSEAEKKECSSRYRILFLRKKCIRKYYKRIPTGFLYVSV